MSEPGLLLLRIWATISITGLLVAMLYVIWGKV